MLGRQNIRKDIIMRLQVNYQFYCQGSSERVVFSIFVDVSHAKLPIKDQTAVKVHCVIAMTKREICKNSFVASNGIFLEMNK